MGRDRCWVNKRARVNGPRMATTPLITAVASGSTRWRGCAARNCTDARLGCSLPIAARPPRANQVKRYPVHARWAMGQRARH
eukprot:2837405-Pyramimonas_sp.AAC.1